MSRLQIQLFVHLEHGCHRNLLRGVSHYASMQEHWDLHVSPFEMGVGGSLYNAGADGIIAHHNLDSELQRLAHDPNLPVVYYGFHKSQPKFKNHIQVFPDESKIGPMAANHLLKRGFGTLVYGHNGRWPSSQERGEAFRNEVEERGQTCHWLDIGEILEKHPQNAVERLAVSLKKLPQPMGIFAINDVAAAFILRALRRADIPVPEKAALLGVDNDELLCTSQTPHLSSLDTGWFSLGVQAGQSLNDLLNHHTLQERGISVPPKEVCTRSSTDVLAFPDELVVQALCYIREKLQTGISVQQVLEKVLVSRPTLDKKFLNYLGHTVTEEINHTRFERACRLVEETQQTIEQVAYETGYKYPDALFRAFRKEKNCTPTEFREAAQTSLETITA